MGEIQKEKKNACPVCNSVDNDIFIEIGEVPVYCNILWLTHESAILVPKGEIHLAFCSVCGHIFNRFFNPELMDYGQDYENSLHFSPRFQTYVVSLAKQLVERYDLHGKQIIDIGCGQGDFLRLLCELGDNRGIGFDPGYRREENQIDDSQQVILIQDFYSEKYRNYTADFICSRHVLEHISNPRDFLNSIRLSAGNGYDIAVYLEVPNAMFTLRDLGIWDIIYEHPSFFSISSIAYLLSKCGFKILDLYESYKGQFLSVEARLLRDKTSLSLELSNSVDAVVKAVGVFAEEYHNKVAYWHNVLEVLTRDSKRIVVWGAGSKGVTFLNTLKTENQIEYIVDINPRKHFRYVSGTGQKIVPPDFLQEYRPDIILVMNAIYKDEIRSMTNDLGLSPKFLFT